MRYSYTSTQMKTYRDSRGIEYKEGDIVYNPCNGDYWVVRYSVLEDNTLCPYQLVLWDSKDEYFMDLDEPNGFEIVRRKGEKDYKTLLKSIHKIRRKHKLMDLKYNGVFRKIILEIVALLGFCASVMLLTLLLIFLPIVALILILIIFIIVVIWINLY